MSVLKDVLSQVLTDLMPRKSFDQVIEEQNTKTVWYPRVWGLPKKYTYGKVPGEPIVKVERHPEGESWPTCASEQDPDVIGGHIAICSHEEGSHGGLCEMCRKLNNPQRRAFLVRLYNDGRSLDLAGFNVGEAVDKSDLNQPATSEYLRQLSDLGLIRRERHGRTVSYIPDPSGAAPWVREVAEMMRERWKADPENEAFVPVFRVMMGPFRSRIVRLLAAGGCGGVEALAERFEKKSSDLIRELEWAVKGGILDLNSEDADGVYEYRTPADPIARRIIELS